MELEFTDEQEELRSSVRSFLEKECPVDVVRAVVETGEAPEKLWGSMVALDWPALAVPEEYGGIGLTILETAVVVEELGRAIAPGPLLATVLTWKTVEIRSTQSATGILYIGMTLVLFGELSALILARGAGVVF